MESDLLNAISWVNYRGLSPWKMQFFNEIKSLAAEIHVGFHHEIGLQIGWRMP